MTRGGTSRERTCASSLRTRLLKRITRRRPAQARRRPPDSPNRQAPSLLPPLLATPPHFELHSALSLSLSPPPQKRNDTVELEIEGGRETDATRDRERESREKTAEERGRGEGPLGRLSRVRKLSCGLPHLDPYPGEKPIVSLPLSGGPHHRRSRWTREVSGPHPVGAPAASVRALTNDRRGGPLSLNCLSVSGGYTSRERERGQ